MTQQPIDPDKKAIEANPQNPYFPFELESGKWFYHEDIVDQIKTRFLNQDCQPIIIHGGAGTGKTSTLRRIAVDPQLLNSQELVVYINLKPYTEVKPQEIPAKFFGDIYENIKKKGLPINSNVMAFTPKPTKKEIKSFFETLKPIINRFEQRIIILDEFEYILETGSKITKSFFQDTLLEITEGAIPFKLILAIEKEPKQEKKDQVFNSFLKKSQSIKVDDFLPESKLAQLIKNPKGDQISFEFADSAVQKVISFCGSNLYLQQLICYYIYEQLSKRGNPFCEEADVEAAVEILLTDHRPDFMFAWKYKLTVDEKIVVSALADLSIVEPKGHHYHLKENTFLEKIFEFELLSKTITKLANENKLTPMVGKRFDQYPFRLPLFGMWLQKTFPFKKTLGMFIEDIAERSLSTAGYILESWPCIVDNNSIKKPGFLEFCKYWYVYKTKLEINIAGSQDSLDFIKLLCKITFGSDVGLEYKTDDYFTFPLNDLKFGHFKKAALFVHTKLDIELNDCCQIQDKILSYRDNEFETLFFLIYFKKSIHIEALLKKGFLRIIYLDEEILRRVVMSDCPNISFKEEIILQSSPTFLSPYQAEGAVTTTFYGRIHIQRQILAHSNRNCAVVGVRRIGKSSLLQNIIKNLPRDVIPIFLDLSHCKHLNTFFGRVSRKLKETLDFEPTPISTPAQFHTMIQELAMKYREKKQKLLFVFDEIDSVIVFDRKNDFALLEVFRVLANEGFTQFIVAGFAELFRAKRELHSPLYNFGDIIQLGPLNEDAALTLVTEPMKSIGLNYKHPTSAKTILHYTSGHPSLTQYFCQRLVKAVEKRNGKKDRRTILKKDIESVYDNEYKKFIINDIYMLRTTEIPPMQELIIVLLVEAFPDNKHSTFETIRERLKNVGVSLSDSQLTANLQELEIRYILVEEANGRYTFPLEMFPDILRNRFDLEEYKQTLLKKLSEVNQ